MSQVLSEVKKYVGLPKEMADKLEAEAQRRTISQSAIIREALLAYFNNQKGQ